eukprot:m.25579 g.25579  ORF g.25579 m.25579 type:complete len:209 (+) comp9881_c1_seq1:104-730(+)
MAETERIQMLDQTHNVNAIITALLDKTTPQREFVAFSHRLIRLVIEAGINFLDMEDHTVQTPTGHSFSGLKLVREPVGISIMRAGEAMEQGLRDSLFSIPMGHMLIQHDHDQRKGDPQIYFHHLPPGIDRKPILLLDPIIDSGATLLNALDILVQEGAVASNIIVLALFASSAGLQRITKRFPTIRIALAHTLENCQAIQFSKRYFGT